MDCRGNAALKGPDTTSEGTLLLKGQMRLRSTSLTDNVISWWLDEELQPLPLHQELEGRTTKSCEFPLEEEQLSHFSISWRQLGWATRAPTDTHTHTHTAYIQTHMHTHTQTYTCVHTCTPALQGRGSMSSSWAEAWNDFRDTFFLLVTLMKLLNHHESNLLITLFKFFFFL